MIVSTALYMVAFLAVWLLVTSILILPTYFAVKAYIYRRMRRGGTTERLRIFKTYAILWMAWAGFVLLAGLPASYYGLSTFLGYDPPFLTRGTQVVDESEPGRKINALRAESQRLTSALSDLENLTIRQIRDTISSTVSFVDSLQEQAVAQEQAIASLRGEAEKQRRNAEEAREMAETVSSLTAPQIEAVKQIITQDARTQTNRGFWLGVLSSFPVGVLASLAAGLLLRRVRRTAIQEASALRETA